MSKKLNGFTLIELIVVLVIISILSVSAFFLLQNVTINLGGQAQQLANDIRYAQSLSMTRGQRYRWIKISSTTYQIQNSSGTPITFEGGNTTVTLESGITFGAFTNLPNNLVNFDGLGAPYSDTATPGTALSATATIPLTASVGTHTISITPGTGRVLVQ